MPYGWEGNRRSGVTLAMHYTASQTEYCNMLVGLRQKEKYPVYTLREYRIAPFTLVF